MCCFYEDPYQCQQSNCLIRKTTTELVAFQRQRLSFELKIYRDHLQYIFKVTSEPNSYKWKAKRSKENLQLKDARSTCEGLITIPSDDTVQEMTHRTRCAYEKPNAIYCYYFIQVASSETQKIVNNADSLKSFTE